MNDPRAIIDDSPMRLLQYLIILITCLLNAVDGFDVLAISVSGPGIMGEFGIGRAELGFVLAMELVGMSIGSVLLGRVADRLGRRSMILGCLLVMASGMYLTTFTTDVLTLCLWRVYTGLGIGGMLSVTNAAAAEFSNKHHRGLCISMMVIGYPLGGIVCGEVGKALLQPGAVNWRDMFLWGASLTALLIPLVYFLVPESVHWLARTQPVNALARTNATLRKLGHATVDELPAIQDQSKVALAAIFAPVIVLSTLLVTAAYFFHMIAFYYVLKWTPTIVVELGIEASAASGVLTWANVGGALGGVVFGLLTTRIGLKPLTIAIMVLTMVGVATFGRSQPDVMQLSYLAAFAGFFGNAGISGLYTIIAYVFPTHLRATGTGFVIGVGRGGAILSPIIAGQILQSGASLGTVGLVMGGFSLLGAVAILLLKPSEDGPRMVERRRRESDLRASA